MEDIRTIDSKSCKEIYVILSKLGLFYKLPEELKEYIYQNQSLSYEYDFDTNLPLIYQINNDKTKAYISYLYIKYINDSSSEKAILLKKYEQNEIINQKNLKEKYSYDNLFKKNNTHSQDNYNVEEVSMIKYKESIFKKLLDKLKRIFH